MNAEYVLGVYAFRMTSDSATKAKPAGRTPVVRLSINLAPPIAEVLKRRATADNLSITDAVRRALGLWGLVQDAQRDGEKVFVRSRDGKERELVIVL